MTSIIVRRLYVPTREHLRGVIQKRGGGIVRDELRRLVAAYIARHWPNETVSAAAMDDLVGALSYWQSRVNE